MAPKESEGGVFVTTKDIYDEVTGMRSDLQEAVTLLRDTIKDVNDHEKRIRFIEKCLYAIPASVIIALASFADHFPHFGK